MKLFKIFSPFILTVLCLTMIPIATIGAVDSDSDAVSLISYSEAQETSGDGNESSEKTIAETKKSTPTTSATSFMLGDIDGDKTVSASDATLVLREYTLLLSGNDGTFDEGKKKASDVNKDGVTDASDATLILRYYTYLLSGGKQSFEYVLENGETDLPTTTTTTTSSTSTTTTTTTTTTSHNDQYEVQDIKLSKYEINIGVGEGDISMVTMLPETAADKGEIWSCSDESVAVVDSEGWIVGLSAGTCTVTVQSRSNPDVKAEIKVTVTDSSNVTDIKLSKYEINIGVGEGDISMVTMLPETAADKGEIWSCSDESVAVVDNEGWIVGLSAGTCTVTVQSRSNPDVKAEIKVTVTDNSKVTGIKLSKYEINIGVGEGDISMVTMLPETVADKGEIWSCSDESIAVVDNEGWIVGLSAGTCIVTVQSRSNPDVKAEIKVTVS